MVETTGFHQVLWLVLLEFAKDRILGVDTPEQHVSPRVWYGMPCLLIRDVVGSVSCSNEWKVTWSFTQAYMVQGHGTTYYLGKP
jgi:hypothetical protein